MTEPAAPTRTSFDATKIAVGIALAAVAAVALVVSPVTLFVLVLALCLVASGELFRIARRRGVVPVPLVGFAMVGAIIGIAYNGPESMLSALPGITAGATALCLIILILRKRIDGALASVATTISASLYAGVLGSFVIAMRQAAYGFRVVLAFGLMACVNDALAYFTGTAAGRHLVGPGISATKTWEGIAGGTAGTFAMAGLAAWQLDPPFSAGRALVLAAIVAVAAPLGELAESALKRDAGVKESGTVLAGHGGVLDRLDGLLFAAPVFYLAYRAMVR